jgi:divalent metal cation (Fe/Co/Zn/Cd) transporter
MRQRVVGRKLPRRRLWAPSDKARHPSRELTDPTRVVALREAAWLCALTVGWNTIVGGAAVATAIATGSLVLIGFGLNAVVDSSASAVLVWRFRAETAGLDERAQRAEQVALRLAGVAFIVIALYLAVQATRSLASSSHSSASVYGIVEAAASVVLLPFLARRKYTLARGLGSRALRADILLTWSGTALSGAALLALLLRRGTGWWWGDPAAALLIAVVLLQHGRPALLDTT